MSRLRDLFGEQGPVYFSWAREDGAGTQWCDGRDLVDTVTLRVGREGAAEDFDSCVLTWRTRTTGKFAAGSRPGIGDRLQVQLTDGAKAYFGIPWTGDALSIGERVIRGLVFVTDVELDYQREGDELVGVLTWTAAGPLARAGQIYVGAEPWPIDYTWVRADRIGDAMVTAMGAHPAAADFTVQQDPNDDTVVKPRDVDSQPGADLLRNLAASTGAKLIEQPYGQITWNRRDDRRQRDPLLELTADELLISARWANSLDALLNDYTVTYGNEQTVRVVDQVSVDRYGRYSSSLSSELDGAAGTAWENDPRDLATVTVGRHSRPRWTVNRLDVDPTRTLEAGKAGKLIAATINELVHVVGLPNDAPAAEWLFVEGFEWTLDRDDWRVSVFVTDAGVTGAPIRWSDVPGSYSWAEAEADMTWLQAAGWFAPPVDGNRWIDVPANVNYYDLTAETWATYDP